MFKQPLPKPIDEMSKLTDPHDDSCGRLESASPLVSPHANCSNCHVEAGGGNAQFSAEIDAKPEQQRLLDAKPVHTTFGLTDARLIAPGASGPVTAVPPHFPPRPRTNAPNGNQSN